VRSRRTAGMAIGTVVLALSALAAPFLAAPARAYPPDQLARGEAVWNAVCAECHGPSSTDPDAPLLLTPGSLKSFPHAAAAFQYARDSMPVDAPGSLAEQDYWDVMAFILQQQGIDRDVQLGPDTAGDVPTT
jgi:mono/diheme cytochrome c family protein